MIEQLTDNLRIVAFSESSYDQYLVYLLLQVSHKPMWARLWPISSYLASVHCRRAQSVDSRV